MTLSAITLERVRYGARIARATDLPILVSGGAVRGAPPEALLMRNALVNEFAVPVRWMETRSRDTHENAVNSAEMLKADGVQRVILVGHSFDFPRTRARVRRRRHRNDRSPDRHAARRADGARRLPPERDGTSTELLRVL